MTLKLPKVPSLVSRTELDGAFSLDDGERTQNRNVVQRGAGKVAPLGSRGILPQRTCVTSNGAEVCMPW